MADEEKGIKWWIRYAIVPLLPILTGGGGIIAIVSFFYMRTHPPELPASKSTVTVQPSPTLDQPKLPSNPVPSPMKPFPQKSTSSIVPPHPTEPALSKQQVDVIIWRPIDLSSEALLVDGKKPQGGVIVDSGNASTTLKLMPGTHSLSANFEGKECLQAFRVPSTERVVLRCKD